MIINSAVFPSSLVVSQHKTVENGAGTVLYLRTQEEMNYIEGLCPKNLWNVIYQVEMDDIEIYVPQN